jgi:uncharacterized membrane protein YgaE (UPF0421/DUF939 family)
MTSRANTRTLMTGWDRRTLEHVARTTAAAVISLALARLLRLPESFWAPVTAVVVMQSTLGASWTASVQRFVGTVIGAAAGAIAATYFRGNALAFGIGIFLLGLFCAALRLDRAAYRFAGITLAIIMLVASAAPPWRLALYRSDARNPRRRGDHGGVARAVKIDPTSALRME